MIVHKDDYIYMVIPAGTTFYKKVRAHSESRRDVKAAVLELRSLKVGILPIMFTKGGTITNLNKDFKLRVPEALVKSVVVFLDNDSSVYNINYVDNVKSIKDAIFTSFHDENFNYVVGKVVKSNWYDADPTEICTNGIHGFLSLNAAIGY